MLALWVENHELPAAFSSRIVVQSIRDEAVVQVILG